MTQRQSPLFEITPSGMDAPALFYGFQGGSDGISPNAPIAYNESYIGTTYGGGLGHGTAYLITPDGQANSEQQILYTFAGGDGGDRPTFLAEFNSLIYGITNFGGSQNNGVLFQLTPPLNPGEPWRESVIHVFDGPSEGAHPQYILAYNSSLYVSLSNGGPGGGGSVVSLAPPATGNTWPAKVVTTFSGPANRNPYNPEGFTIVSPELGGVIVGVTAQGGSPNCQFNGYQGCGVVYAVSLLTGTLRPLISFKAEPLTEAPPLRGQR